MESGSKGQVMKALVLFVCGLIALAIGLCSDSSASDSCKNGDCPRVQIKSAAEPVVAAKEKVDVKTQPSECVDGSCHMPAVASEQRQAVRSTPRFGQRVRTFVRQPFGGFFRRVFGRQ